jgi:hypothetical protein
VWSYSSDNPIGLIRYPSPHRDIMECGFKQGCWFLVTLL